jgi:small ligand-binding sensory domain FIST
MKFASAISSATDAEEAVHDIIAHLHPHSPSFDFASIYFTSHFSGDADSISQTLIDEFDIPSIIGCSCEGVIGRSQEIEKGPALSVIAGKVPGVRVQTFHLSKTQWQNALADAEAMADHFMIGPDTRAVIGMGDPWTTPIMPVLDKFDTHHPTVPLIGGIASAAQKAGENVLLFNDARFDEGMVGVSLSGAIDVEAVVSQGCRPIGRPLLVTKGQGNVIEQLGGRPALEVLEEIVNALTDTEKLLLTSGLLIGRAMNEYKPTLTRGDFVVRNIIGVNDDHKAIGVGDRIKVGQTVQFHVRDAATAHEDLNLILATRKTKSPAGAMLFSCNGRGTRLFAQPHHDAVAAANLLGDIPLAGFFAAGELGPVAGRNFIHAHTASFALFSGR